MNKKFKFALLTGRYQTIQNGHIKNIIIASELAEKVLIVVGSAQESGTMRNPFDVKIRVMMLNEIIRAECLSNVEVVSLDDYTNENDICHEWGKYLLDFVFLTTGCKPDLIIHGDDGRGNDPILWLSDEDKVGIHFLLVPRNSDSISATKMREHMVCDEWDAWKIHSNTVLYKYFNFLRVRLLAIPFYRKMIKLTCSQCKITSDVDETVALREQNTAYHEEALNWIIECDTCFQITQEYWEMMWREHGQGYY